MSIPMIASVIISSTTVNPRVCLIMFASKLYACVMHRRIADGRGVVNALEGVFDRRPRKADIRHRPQNEHWRGFPGCWVLAVRDSQRSVRRTSPIGGWVTGDARVRLSRTGNRQCQDNGMGGAVPPGFAATTSS